MLPPPQPPAAPTGQQELGTELPGGRASSHPQPPRPVGAEQAWGQDGGYHRQAARQGPQQRAARLRSLLPAHLLEQK